MYDLAFRKCPVPYSRGFLTTQGARAAHHGLLSRNLSRHRWSLMVLAGLEVLIFVISQPCTLLVNPGRGAPAAILMIEESWMNSPTSLTVLMRNSGRESTTLSSYYVKDSAGRLYASPGWKGPTIPGNAPMNVTFTIDGKAFTFQQNSSYTVTVHDSQNYDWTFSASF